MVGGQSLAGTGGNIGLATGTSKLGSSGHFVLQTMNAGEDGVSGGIIAAAAGGSCMPQNLGGGVENFDPHFTDVAGFTPIKALTSSCASAGLAIRQRTRSCCRRRCVRSAAAFFSGLTCRLCERCR